MPKKQSIRDCENQKSGLKNDIRKEAKGKSDLITNLLEEVEHTKTTKSREYSKSRTKAKPKVTPQPKPKARIEERKRKKGDQTKEQEQRPEDASKRKGECQKFNPESQLYLPFHKTRAKCNPAQSSTKRPRVRASEERPSLLPQSQHAPIDKPIPTSLSQMKLPHLTLRTSQILSDCLGDLSHNIHDTSGCLCGNIRDVKSRKGIGKGCVERRVGGVKDMQQRGLEGDA
jgi:hypothetical protein